MIIASSELQGVLPEADLHFVKVYANEELASFSFGLLASKVQTMIAS